MSLYSSAIACVSLVSPSFCFLATYSAIISSSSRYFRVAGPIIPGRSFYTSRSSPVSLSAYPGTSGQGPTKLMLPMKTSHNPGGHIQLLVPQSHPHRSDMTAPSHRHGRAIVFHCHCAELVAVEQLTSKANYLLYKKHRPTRHLHLNHDGYHQHHQP